MEEIKGQHVTLEIALECYHDHIRRAVAENAIGLVDERALIKHTYEHVAKQNDGVVDPYKLDKALATMVTAMPIRKMFHDWIESLEKP